MTPPYDDPFTSLLNGVALGLIVVLMLVAGHHLLFP